MIPFSHNIIPRPDQYCTVSSWSYAIVNPGGISNFSSSVEDCLSAYYVCVLYIYIFLFYLLIALPVVTNINMCFGLDLRPGYRGHFYAYVTWDILFDTGKLCVYCISVYLLFND